MNTSKLYNSHIFQFCEYWSQNNHEYLLIPKNGCTTVLAVLGNNEKKFGAVNLSKKSNNNLTKWTVIREPYERFISGLVYDLYSINEEYFFDDKNSEKNIIKFLENNMFDNIFYSYVPVEFARRQRLIPHTTLQATWLINQTVDFFVDLKDLDNFLFFNYFDYDNTRYNANNKHHYSEFIKSIINNNTSLKEKIITYLAPDLYIYKRVINSGMLWKTQYGKVLY